MRMRSLLGLALLVLCGQSSGAVEKEMAKPLAPVQAGVGRRVPDVKGSTIDGKEFQSDHRWFVLLKECNMLGCGFSL